MPGYIFPAMPNGSVDLPAPTDYFYLCGYARGPARRRGANNLHLAVEPMPGSTATVTSTYDPVFTIEGARQIVIPASNEPRAAYGSFDRRCMNFRFGSLMYPAKLIGPDAPRVPILKAK